MKKIIYAISSILISSIFSKGVSADTNNSKIPFHMLDKLVIRDDKNETADNSETNINDEKSKGIVVILPSTHDTQLAKHSKKGSKSTRQLNAKNAEENKDQTDKEKEMAKTAERVKLNEQQNKIKDEKKTVEIPLELPKDEKKQGWPQKMSENVTDASEAPIVAQEVTSSQETVVVQEKAPVPQEAVVAEEVTTPKGTVVTEAAVIPEPVVVAQETVVPEQVVVAQEVTVPQENVAAQETTDSLVTRTRESSNGMIAQETIVSQDLSLEELSKLTGMPLIASIEPVNDEPITLANQESIMERIKQKEENLKMAIDDLKDGKDDKKIKSEVKDSKPIIESINAPVKTPEITPEPKIEVVAPEIPKQCKEDSSQDLNVAAVPTEILKEENTASNKESNNASQNLNIAEAPVSQIAENVIQRGETIANKETIELQPKKENLEAESKVLQLALESTNLSTALKQNSEHAVKQHAENTVSQGDSESQNELFTTNEILERPIQNGTIVDPKTLALSAVRALPKNDMLSTANNLLNKNNNSKANNQPKKGINIFEKTDSELTMEEEAISEYHRALNLIAMDNIVEAEEVLREILDVVPHYRGVRVELAKIYLKTSREDIAENLVQKGLCLSREYPEFLKLMAIICERKGSPDIALEYLSKIPDNQKRDLSTAAFIGQIYQQTGRYSLARNQYFQLLEREPNNPIWLLGISIALESEGKKKEALQGYKRILKEGSLDMDLLRYVEERITNLKG